MKLRKFLYITNKSNCLIMIFARAYPSAHTVPISGTWIIREWHKSYWVMPCFPEIVWETLKKFQYIGEIK